jgi:hypothetical protein
MVYCIKGSVYDCLCVLFLADVVKCRSRLIRQPLEQERNMGEREADGKILI